MAKRGGFYRMKFECAVNLFCEDCAKSQECDYWETANDGDVCVICGYPLGRKGDAKKMGNYAKISLRKELSHKCKNMLAIDQLAVLLEIVRDECISEAENIPSETIDREYMKGYLAGRISLATVTLMAIDDNDSALKALARKGEP